MSRRYRYVSANTRTSTRPAFTECGICGQPMRPGVGHVYRDQSNTELGVCTDPVCRTQAETADYSRNDTEIIYRIRSGWQDNPIWDCQVIFGGPQTIYHLHTTQAAGDSPTVFSGETSGLQFAARGAFWPVEARDGKLIVVDWNDDEPTETEITAEQAIKVALAARSLERNEIGFGDFKRVVREVFN